MATQGPFLTSSDWQEEPCIEKLAYVTEAGGKTHLNYVTL